MSSIINVLDTATANKIAAGEVVERPSSCIKELIENAIDAGASSIEAEIADGGQTYMRVTDNGCGMERLTPEDMMQHITRATAWQPPDWHELLANTHRLTRLLCAIEMGDGPAFVRAGKADGLVYDAFVVGLRLPRDLLYERINGRVDAMDVRKTPPVTVTEESRFFKVVKTAFSQRRKTFANTMAAMVIYRPFCRFICPLGAFYGLFNKLAAFGIAVDAERCTHCGACQAVCPMNRPTMLNRLVSQNMAMAMGTPRRSISLQ